MGIEIQKEWVCTHDDRTRPSHLELDGERRDLDEEFSNGLQYPGDPDGDPSEVYNCRCTMVAFLPDLDDDTRGAAGDVSEEEYKEWEEKQKSQELEIYKVEENEVERTTDYLSKSADRYVSKTTGAKGVAYYGVHKYVNQPPEEYIIKKLGVYDTRSRGVCQSEVLAYTGQKCGIDVVDNRGGISMEFFQLESTMSSLTFIKGVVSDTVTLSRTPLADTLSMLKKMTKGKANLGKEFILSTGHHAAIVKRTGSNTYKYLELQHYLGSANGWYPLTETSLRERFYVTKTDSIGRDVVMIDVESLGNSKEFQGLLGYIQKKIKEAE